MIETISFKLDFDKFGLSEKISLSPGLHVVYGESGCGKSHLIRQLAGMNDQNPSHFQLIQKSVPESVQIVFQNPENQILSHNLTSEVAFALECQSTDTEYLQKTIENIRTHLPFVDDWGRHPSSLSGGEMEMLNLVTAFSSNSALILIDDGLSFMNEHTKSLWVKWIKEEIQTDQTVIWFTSEISDTIYGDTIWVLSLSAFGEFNGEQDHERYSYRSSGGELSLIIRDLSFSFPKDRVSLIQDWNCHIENARSIGLIGNNGKGKTTLSQLITGFLHQEKGTIDLRLKNQNPTVAQLDQFPERMLGPESLEAMMMDLVRHEKMNQRLINKCINRLKSYQINWDIIRAQSALDIPWSTLRMALIIILAHCEYDVLIFDEPTFGLGWEQKLILSRFFQEILYHKHMILISHDTDFVSAHCDHIYNIDSQSITYNQSISTDAE